MKNLLKLEEAAMFGVAVLYFYQQMDFSGWVFWLLILTPDIGMLGYIVNNQVGAQTYNLFHHKGVALAIFMVGLITPNSIAELIGLVLFTHSCMDRMVGYGLKYPDDFKNTHLGRLPGKQS